LNERFAQGVAGQARDAFRDLFGENAAPTEGDGGGTTLAIFADNETPWFALTNSKTTASPAVPGGFTWNLDGVFATDDEDSARKFFQGTPYYDPDSPDADEFGFTEPEFRDRKLTPEQAEKIMVHHPLDIPGGIRRTVMTGLDVLGIIQQRSRVATALVERRSATAFSHPLPEADPGSDFGDGRYSEIRKEKQYPVSRKGVRHENFATGVSTEEDRAALADWFARGLLEEAPSDFVRSQKSIIDGEEVPINHLPARDIGYLFGPWETSRYDLENIRYASRATIPNITAVLRALLQRLDYYERLNRRNPERDDPIQVFNAAVRKLRQLRSSYLAARRAQLPGVQRQVLEESETQRAICRRFLSELGDLPPGVRFRVDA